MRKVESLVTKTVLDRALIAEGDRILIACSGGKDSTVLAMTLSRIRPALKIGYTLTGLHISTDFCACCKKPILKQRLSEWGIPFFDVFVPVIASLQRGKKMNCYWCSTRRRAALLRFAVENGYNKIALGHHLDDIIETFFMNLTLKGVLETMPLSISYRKYPVTLIRPLALVEERQVIDFAAENDILKAVCTCPFGQKSPRRSVRTQIEALCAGDPTMKRRIFRAIDTVGDDSPIGDSPKGAWPAGISPMVVPAVSYA